jgi:hypothetical protein
VAFIRFQSSSWIRSWTRSSVRSFFAMVPGD